MPASNQDPYNHHPHQSGSFEDLSGPEAGASASQHGGPKDYGDLREIAGLLAGFSNSEQIQAVALAIRGASQEEDRRERERKLAAREKREGFVVDLEDAAGIFIDRSQAAVQDRQIITSLMNFAGSLEHFKARKSSIVSSVPTARSMDSMLLSVFKQVSVLAGYQEAARLYRHSRAERVKLEQSDPGAHSPDEFLNIRENHVTGYLIAIESMKATLENFPVFCRDLMEIVKQNDRAFRRRYLDEGESQTQPGFSLSFVPEEPEEKVRVPVYKSNLYLTAFLHEIVNRIPVQPGKEDDYMTMAAYDREMESFYNLLSTHGDPNLLAAIKTPVFFEGTGRALGQIYRAFGEVLQAYEESEVEKVRARRGIVDARTFMEASQRATEAFEGIASDKIDNFDTFNPGDLLRTLRQYAPQMNQATSTESSKNLSERQQAYITLFEKLDQILDKISREALGGEVFLKSRDGIKEIDELVELKAELFGSELKKRQSRLNQDKEDGNYCFSATQKGMGQLALEQVPTHNTGFADVIGSSWKTVREKVDGILDYTELGYLYSQMSSRGKANNNLLIIGPYGCGKNEFLKALMSDQRTVGLNMTTDRLMSFWHGQDENNTRALFELAQKKHEELGKPVVIGWDEFDSNFGKRGQGGFSVGSELDGKRQKILQSVLEGDTVYDGVALIGLSNEPMQIPVAIYRRFADVVVIDPLSAEERVDLVQHMLKGLPLEQGFDEKAGWSEFMRETDYASGHIIGRIYDHAFAQYVKRLKTEDRPAAKRINDAAREIVMAGNKLTGEDRVRIFRDHTSFELLGEDFRKAREIVLARTDIRQGIEQQKLFYRDVEKMMEAAFRGSL